MNGRNAPIGRSLMLVNAAHPVPASALPERLERVRGVNGDIPLERTAARALRGLVSAIGGLVSFTFSSRISLPDQEAPPASQGSS